MKIIKKKIRYQETKGNAINAPNGGTGKRLGGVSCRRQER